MTFTNASEAHELLDKYSLGWQRYWSSAQTINALSRYLNKCLLQNTQTVNLSAYKHITLHNFDYQVTNIQELARQIWQREVLSHFTDHSNPQNNLLITAIGVAMQTQWKAAAAPLLQALETIRTCIESFNCTAFDSKIMQYRLTVDPRLIKYLAALTSQHYNTVAQELLAKHNLSQYIQEAAKLLDAESSLIEYLWQEHPQLIEPFVKSCEDALIGSNIALLESSFNNMLRDQDLQQLSLTFGLLLRIPGALAALQASFERSVVMSIVELWEKRKMTENDVVAIFGKMVRLHKKFIHLIEGPFAKHPQMQQAHIAAWKQAINYHVKDFGAHLAHCFDVCQRSPNVKQHRTLLSYLIDSLNILNLLEAPKDASSTNGCALLQFANLNYELLARRLALQLSECGDEEVLLERLDALAALPAEYKSRLHRMLVDIRNGQFVDDENGFSVLVMTELAWPAALCNDAKNSATMALPPDNMTKAFEDRYKERFPTRHLNWCPTFTRLNVSLNGADCDAELVMSMQQWSIIHQLQQSATIRLHRIPTADHWALQPLLEAKIVALSGKGQDQVIYLCCKGLRGCINLLPDWAFKHDPTHSIVGADNAVVSTVAPTPAALGTESASSSHLLQCCIVTLLKRHRQLSPAELFKHCAAHFAKHPNFPFALPRDNFDREMQIVLQKGFAEYSQANNLYQYLA